MFKKMYVWRSINGILTILILLVALRFLTSLHITQSLYFRGAALRFSWRQPNYERGIDNFESYTIKSNEGKTYGVVTYTLTFKGSTEEARAFHYYEIKDHLLYTYHTSGFITKVRNDETTSPWYWLNFQPISPVTDTEEEQYLHLQIRGFNRMGASQLKLTTNKGVELFFDLPNDNGPFIFDFHYENEAFLDVFDRKAEGSLGFSYFQDWSVLFDWP